MKIMEIPKLEQSELNNLLNLATNSERRRAPKILHKPGASFNEVINIVMRDSYMQPHNHPSNEKIEKIYIIQGKMAVVFFDKNGTMNKSIILESGVRDLIEIPAFSWHTYVALTDYTVSYETMDGIYDPKTWKEFALWAPKEGTQEAIEYLANIKKEAVSLSIL